MDHEKGVIIEMKDIGPNVKRDEIKAILAVFGTVKYVELQNGSTEGFLRMEQPEEALKVVKLVAENQTPIGGKVPQLRILEGDEEETYWQKIKSSSSSRDGRKKGRGGKRGRGRKKKF